MWRNLNQTPPHRGSRRSFAILAQDLSASAPATLFPLRYAELIALLMQPTLHGTSPNPSRPFATLRRYGHGCPQKLPAAWTRLRRLRWRPCGTVACFLALTPGIRALCPVSDEFVLPGLATVRSGTVVCVLRLRAKVAVGQLQGCASGALGSQ